MKKKLIRSGVWETNSSSSHSVSIADDTKQFVMDNLYPDDQGIIHVYSDEFGWDWFKHNDAETKVKYAAQQFQNNDTTLDLIREIIMEQTGASDVIFNLDGGYIDHDSYGILESGKEYLRNFIFNKNSWLFGGNDNSSTTPTFYDVPEYKDDKIIQPVYKYNLVIDKFNISEPLKEIPNNEYLSELLSSLLCDIRLNENGNHTRNYNTSFEYDFKGHLPVIDYDNRLVYFTRDVTSEAKILATLDHPDEPLNYNMMTKYMMDLYMEVDSPYTKKVKYDIIEI